jgi:hypothetical protein
MRALELVESMGITIGRPEIVIGSIDGTVALDHPDLAGKPPSRVECAGVRILQDKGNERDFNGLAESSKDKGAISG